MGGATAFDATNRGLASAGWSVTALAPWTDLDTMVDLSALALELEGDGRHAPRTAAWIEAHREVVLAAPPPRSAS